MKKCDKCVRLGIIKHCGDLKLFLLYKDYVKKLIEEDGFIVVQGQYSVFDACRNADGCWVDDIICYSVQCPNCKRIYLLSADTYHGRFSFDKM